MPDLSWSHILLVLVVALVVVGPKDLPKLMRTMGQWMGKAREMAGYLRKNFDDLSRQAELDELKGQIKALQTRQPFSDIERKVDVSLTPDPSIRPKSSEERPQSVKSAGQERANQVS